jgi:hypothetical protein
MGWGGIKGVLGQDKSLENNLGSISSVHVL